MKNLAFHYNKKWFLKMSSIQIVTNNSKTKYPLKPVFWTLWEKARVG